MKTPPPKCALTAHTASIHICSSVPELCVDVTKKLTEVSRK